MLALLAHRGPDDQGIFYDDEIGLANSRLSIVDVAEGHQPMCNEDANVWVTFNGEIFNHQEHRSRLETQGHVFSTRADTEVLVHLYEEQGVGFLSQLNGMFAFALWDSTNRRLLLARDYAGMKPLYYSEFAATFFFASEIKALLPVLGETTVDVHSLADFLLLGYVPHQGTMFSGIKKLRPGCFLALDKEGLRIGRYNAFRPLTSHEAPRTLETRLANEISRAVKTWLMSDVPLGAYISGGLDSSLIAALTARLKNESLQTYTAWFGPEFPNELEEAAVIARYLSTDHTEVEVDEQRVLRELARIAWYYDEPIADSAIIPTYFVSREARKKVKVVLAGEAADELFGGYPWYQLYKYLGFLHRRDKPGGDSSLPEVLRLEPHVMGLLWPGLSITQSYLVFHSTFQPSTIRKLLPGAVHTETFRVFGEFLDGTAGERMSRILLCDTMTLLAESFLMKADKGSMANSIEERTPYLDKGLIEFALQIPSGLKVRLGEEKVILRRVAREILPKSTARRRKRGYGTPFTGWIRREIGDYLANLVAESNRLNRLLDRSMIAKVCACRASRPKEFWTLGSLALWESAFADFIRD